MNQAAFPEPELHWLCQTQIPLLTDAVWLFIAGDRLVKINWNDAKSNEALMLGQ